MKWIHNNKFTTYRLTWILLVTAAVLGIAQFSYLLSQRYASSTLSTVIESIMYPVAGFSFPALTICNNNRVNWDKYELARNKYFTYSRLMNKCNTSQN